MRPVFAWRAKEVPKFLKMITVLLCCGSNVMTDSPHTPEGDELDVLATPVDAYEARHHSIGAPTPIGAIQFPMDQQQLSRKDLESMIGSRARVRKSCQENDL
jgi:antitoxin component HigA of HigAB toxin-antitoxin module